MHDREQVLEVAALRPDIRAAVAVLGSAPVAATTVGGWRAGRATYRVTLADGRVVKARQLQSRANAARAAALTAAVGDPRLPAPLAVVGAVMVDAWFTGTPLAARPLTDADIDAAADLLGRLHAVTHVPGHRFHRHRSLTAVAVRFERQLGDLAAAGVLNMVERRRLAARVRDELPDRGVRGVNHGDLQPENLVVTPGGDLVSVDNEAVCFDFLDYDLGRTWCRWPMPTAAWARFLRTYGGWGRPALDSEAESAWRLLAAVRGAHRWHRAVRANTDAPLLALRRVLDDLC